MMFDKKLLFHRAYVYKRSMSARIYVEVILSTKVYRLAYGVNFYAFLTRLT